MRKALYILLVAMLLVSPVYAKSVRGIQVFFVDEFGRPATSITSITVFNAGLGTSPTIYADKGVARTMTNPITTSSDNTTFDQTLGLVRWFQTEPDFKLTVTDGTKTLTVDNMNASDTRFAWYDNYIGTAASLSVGDNESISVGSDSDMDLAWVNASDVMQWIPNVDGTAFNIGSTTVTKQVDFNVYVGGIGGGGMSLNEGTSAFTWLSAGAFTVNATGAGTTAFHAGGTGTIAIGSGTSGAWAIDGTAGGTINADDSIAMTVSAGTIGIASTGGDLTVDATDKSVIIRGTEAIADAIWIDADAGGVDLTSAATFDIDLTATGGKIIATASENAANTVHLEENGGTSGTINLYSNQGTGASATTEHDASIQLQSDAGGIGLYTTGDVADAVRIETNGGVDEFITINNLQGTGADAITIAANAAGGDVNIDSVLGRIEIEAEEDVANALYLIADGSTASTIEIFNDTGTAATEGAASIQLLSDVGGIAIQSGLDGAAIVLLADAGTSEVILINADQGTGVGSVTLDSDDGGITFNTGTGADDGINYNGRTDSLIVLEGTADGFETKLTFTDPSADGVINFPDTADEGAAGGEVAWIADAGTTTKDASNAALPVTDAVVIGTSGGASAWSLPNGEEGQILTVVIGTDGGEATITPDTASGGGWATVVLTDDIDGVTFLYVDDTIGWVIIGTFSDGTNIVAVTQ